MSGHSATTVVPDASVILKWVLDAEDEPGHAAASDASYLAVAEERNAVLVTADTKFFRRLPAGLAVELLD